jgi:IS5 family transposase
MVSLADPDARPIRRGKLSAPVEFGYKVTLADGREGFIEAYSVVQGNPVDHQLLAPVIEAYTTETGRAPAAVAADRGFGVEPVERMLKDKGVRTVAVPCKGKSSAERAQVERAPYFRRLVRWRTGCEGRISHFKRRFGGRRTRFRRMRGARTWVGFGVLAHNLAKVGSVA